MRTKPNNTFRTLIFSALLFIGFNLPGYRAEAQIDVRVDHPTALPVLPNTTVAVDPKKGYLLKEIRDKVYYVTDGLYQMMFIVTDDGVVAVDAPPYIGANILKAIKEVTDKPVTYVIYSHCHPDHIGSAWLYPPGAQYITGEKSAEELARHNTGAGTVPFGIFVGGKPVPTPTRTFKDSLTLVVGGRTIKLLTINQAAHSSQDIIVFLPKEKIAMVVDIVWPGWIPFDQMAYSEDIDGYLNIQKYLLTLDFDTLVAGHWSKLGTKQDIIINMEYVHDLLFYEAEGFAKADFKQLAAKTGTQNINLFMENYFDEVALYAAKKVEAKWDGRLSGCDVWTYNHARRLVPFVRESGVTIPLQ